jgi:hypothetical protein
MFGEEDIFAESGAPYGVSVGLVREKRASDVLRCGIEPESLSAVKGFADGKGPAVPDFRDGHTVSAGGIDNNRHGNLVLCMECGMELPEIL